MSTQKMKKGFTLIELMVVIVIIGILAAIAIPKLFGMSAKAKASEVGSAGGSWSKLQLAYTIEKDEVGTFQEVGYDYPGKTKSDDANKGESANFSYNGSDSGIFSAQNINKLNDCAGGDEAGTWNITYTYSEEDGAEGTASIDGEGCNVLTPNFCRIVDKDATDCPKS